MPSKNYLLFCDLETTGNRPDDDIIEIGLVLTDRNLDVIANHGWLISPGTHRRIRDIDPIVLNMHAVNGLWDELSRVQNNYEIVEDDILNWLNEHTNNEQQHIPLCGSGVSHFDRPYIRRLLPRLDKRLTYWHLDVGVFRRMLNLFGVSEDFLNMYVTQKPHRALDDALLVVAEMRAYMTVERRQSGLNPVIPWQHPVPGLDE